jgi:zinc D-Ala-D-Ala carboxypeptidase
MTPITTAIPYFSITELQCKGTGVIKLDPRFADALPKLREAWGSALVPNSVCRTPEHNRSMDPPGHPNSLHLTENPRWPTLGCMAADIRWRGWEPARQLAFARVAWGLGWSVGLHDGFCHVDRRADLNLKLLPQSVFLYGTWTGSFGRDDVVA